MTEGNKPRLVGINHVAIEVGDIDKALEWYGGIFDFKLRGKGERNAFIDMGDQFINLTMTPDYAVSGSRSGTSALSWTIAAASSSWRKRPAQGLSKVLSSTSSILGAIGLRSSNIPTFSFPRRPM